VDSVSPLIFCIALIPLTNELNRADCGYQVHGTERKISHLLYTDDLILLGSNENDLENEMKIVQTISKNVNMKFGLEKCKRVCFKRCKVQSKMYVRSTFENDTKEQDPRKYIGVSESKVPYFFATKILHIIRCLFLQLLLTSFTIFYVVTFSVDARV